MTSPSFPMLPRKLPFWRTVGACYVIVLRNFGQLLRISWLWLVMLLPVYAAVYWLIWPWTIEVGQSEAGIMGHAATMLPNVVEIPALASIAVAWHRLVLRGDSVRSAFYLRIDHVVGWYALVLLIFLGLIIGPFAYGAARVGILPEEPDDLSAVWVPVAVAVIPLLAAMAIGFLLLPRLSLVLPAIALRERQSLLGVWRATASNTWRLAWASVLCSFPPLILLAPVYVFADLDARTASVVAGTISSLAYVLIVTIAVTLLSLAYRYLVWQEPIDGSAAA